MKERGKNLLAIECDGAAYHSSLVARTRDRARQRILEGRGWRGRIHRVWSTNWWYFEQQEETSHPRSHHFRSPSFASCEHTSADTAPRVRGTRHRGRPRTATAEVGASTCTRDQPAYQRWGDIDGKGKRSPAAKCRLETQLGLEVPRAIGGAKLTATELRRVLYQVIPNSGKIGREKLLETISQNIGVSLDNARRIKSPDKRGTLCWPT